MRDPEVLGMSMKIDGNKEDYYNELYALKSKSTIMFDCLRSEFAYHANLKEVSRAQFNEISTRAIKECIKQTDSKLNKQYFDAALNGCDTLNSLAALSKSNSRELQQICKVGKMSINFAKKAHEIHGLMADAKSKGLADAMVPKNATGAKAAEGITKGLTDSILPTNAAEFLALANPVTALVTIGIQIFMSLVIDTGPSFEQIMLEQLQAISKQIADLHEDMLQQFGEVHEHLRVMHASILRSANDLSVLITSQVGGLRNALKQTLKEIIDSLNLTREGLAEGQIEILLQPLVELCNTVTSRIDGDTHKEESKIASKLEKDWILGQSASPMLNGMLWYKTKHNVPSWEKGWLPADNVGLQKSLGYLACIGKEIK
jgi:hypothetical protein